MKKITQWRTKIWQVMLSFLFVFLFSPSGFGQVIISQYIETNSGTTPKGVEIWNNSGSSIDFSVNNLVIKKGGNGGTPSADATVSSGTLADGEVWVIGTSDLGTYLTNEGIGTANYTEKAFTFNGDDALELWIGTTKEDVFGNPGSDPGSAWTGNGVSTKNQNIALLSGITTGDTDGWTDPSERFETISTDPVNDMSGFGVAPVSGGGSDPTITVSSGLSDFYYVEGNGPSASQSFTVEGANLTADITVTPPTNYEISDDDATFQSSAITLVQSGGTVNTTTLYTRLKAGLSAATYDENITCSSTDATDKTIALSGSVEAPATTTLPYSENFDTDLGDCYTYSVSGATKEWGYSSNAAVMNGHNSGDLETDWLILPGINLDNYSNEGMTFTTEYQYGTDDADNYLKLYYSTDYSGLGDPSSATWVALSYTQPSAATTETESGVVDLSGISGTMVYIGFKYNYNSGSYRSWTVDNIAIDELNKPEPSNHASGFAAAEKLISQIDLSWSDNDGADPADNFLVLANTTGTFSDPVDGTEQADDTDLSDGAAVVNVAHGTETLSFTGLAEGTTYYFTIYPYSNAGENIDFKTDGTVPTANATTCISISAPTANAATDVNETVFTANWDAVTGADSYRLDVYTEEAGTNPELALNGGFENWTGSTPDDWTLIDAGITFSEETTEIHGGSSAASIEVTTGTQGNTDFRQTVSVENGKTYDFSVWLKHTEGNMKARIYVGTYGSYSDNSNTTTWQEMTTSYTATSSGDIEIGMRFYDQSGFDGSEIVYVDDLSFKEEGSAVTETYVTGYEDKTVTGTSQSVTGLTVDNTYKYRVRAYSNCGTGTTTDNSNVIEVTTYTPDTDAPVATFDPANSATDIAIDVNPTITFDEAVYKSDGNAFTAGEDVSSLLTFTESVNTDNAVSFTATITGQVITIVPAADLDYELSYTITLAASAVEDAAGNEIAQTSAAFTTIENPDHDAPVATFDPDNDATAIAVAVNPTITFNEAVYKAADGAAFTANEVVDFIRFTETTTPANTVDFTATINGKVITIVPDSDLDYDMNYTLTLNADAVEDAAGNQNAEAAVAFTTVGLSDVSFAVDMSIEYYDNAWDSTATNLDVSGNFRGASAIALADPDKDLIYTGIATDQVIGSDLTFRFRKNGATNQEDADRNLTVVDGDNSVEVFYNDEVPEERADFEYFKVDGQASPSIIDTDKDSVFIDVLYDTDVTALVPDFDVSPGAQVTPTSGEAQDFTNDVKYTIASYGDTKINDWWVHVNVLDEPNHAAEIESFSFAEQTGAAVIDSDNGTINIEVQWDADITDLAPIITLSGGATVSPESGVSQDFTNPFTYTVTAEDETTIKTWEVTVTKQQVADVTFNVNMNKQVNLGNFVAGTDTVRINATFGIDTLVDPDKDGIYTLTKTNQVVGATIDYKFQINTNEELNAEAARSVTVVSGANEVSHWFDNVEYSTEAEITGFEFAEQTGEATINSGAGTIAIQVAWDAVITNLTPTITLSDYATVNPHSGVAQDFTDPVTYTVTAENNTDTKNWTVTVTQQQVADVTFNVNMNKQINLGNFNATTDVVKINATFGTESLSDADADGIYTLTKSHLEVGTVIDYKFVMNITEELDGEAERTLTVEASGNTVSHWFDNVEFAATALVVSTEYTVDNAAETITNIPFGTDLATFNANITAQDYGTFVLYEANGTTEATTVETGFKLTVTAENNVNTKTYTITVNEEVIMGEGLIISQYYEGTSNNKWIEITNLSAASIDLTNYYLGRWSGTDTPTGVYDNGSALTGTIAAGEVKLYKNEDSALPNYCDGEVTTATYFNGDDPVAITYGSTNWEDRIDCIYGSLDAGNWGKDISFVRKDTILVGNTGISDLSGNGEWIMVSLDDVNNAAENTNERLGYHAPEADTDAPVATFTPENGATDVLVSTVATIEFDENVFKATDGTAFTDGEDVSAFITFAETATPANTVAFAATISDNVITVTPTANLANEMQYTVTLNAAAVEDESGNENVETATSFTTIDAASPVLVLTSPVGGEMYYAGEEATITWTSANISNVKLEVYNPNEDVWFELLASTDASDGTETITIDADASSSDAYKLRIVDVEDTAIADTSEAFEIVAIATNISGLREKIVGGKVKLNGAATVTWVQDERHQKYIQDASAAILIDDNLGIITSTYAIGDEMPGLEGTLAESNGMLQFVPLADPGAPSNTGLTVTPQEITIAEFNNNFEVYEAELIQFTGVYFTELSDNENFANETAYEIANDTDTASLYTSFNDVDYIGTAIPIAHGKITGIAHALAQGTVITPRDASEFEFPASVATLSDLTVDGSTVTNFSPETLNYIVVLPVGTTDIPVVAAVTTDVNATAIVTQATELPGAAIVEVTAEDNETVWTYTVGFTFEDLSSDATLSDLTVDGETIAGFDAATLNYSVVLPYGTTEIPVIAAIKADTNATMAVNQAAELPGDATVVVTAEDLVTVKTYTVSFTVAPNNDATLADLTVNGETIMGFDASTLSYNVILPYGTTDIPVVAATATDENAALAITQATELPGDAVVVVTAEDETTVLTYTVSFSIAPNTDATLADLTVNDETVDGFDPGNYHYEILLPYGTTDIPVVGATATDENAQVTITQAETVDGMASVVVLAADGVTSLTYEILFDIMLNTDATLSDLTINGETVAGFDPEVETYNVALPYGTTDIPQVDGTTNDPNAAMTVTQATELPGSAEISVVAEDAQVVKLYTVNFTIAETPAYNVTFVVTDENEDPIAEAQVYFNEQFVNTDANGVAVYENVAPVEDAAYSISATDYVAYQGTITVVDQDTVVNVTLEFVGINNHEKLISSLYPNPTNGILNITFSRALNDAHLTITNINGKVIAHVQVAELAYKLDLTGYEQGIYFIKVVSDNKTFIEKVMLK